MSGVNITFVDLDAHGSADCLAIFKLRHDNKHATEGQVSHQRTWNRRHTNKRGEINKMWQLGKLKKKQTYTEREVRMEQTENTFTHGKK